MSKLFNFYGQVIFNPGVYSKILTVGNAAPTPSGETAVVYIAEAPNGPEFGTLVTGEKVSDFQKVLGESGPAIEAVFRGFNASPSLSPATDIRVFNPRALVQATGMIETVAAGADAISVGSRIYGPIGNNIHLSLASTVATVSFPWSDEDYTATIDNPVLTVQMTAGYITITSTAMNIGPTGDLTEFKFADYPKLIDLITAIEATISTCTVTKDVNISDNQLTVDYFDHIVSETSIATAYEVKADLNQLIVFLRDTVSDLEIEKQSTATVMVADFDFYLTGGTSGSDPDATQWGLVYDELETQRLAVTCPIADGMAAPYNSTLTAAIMVLDEAHAVKMNGPSYRGMRRQSFISSHGGYGWAGGYVAKPSTADDIVTIAITHNSEYSQFFGDGLNAITQQGVELEQLPCYFAAQCASMFLGGLASRVLTSQSVTGIKASTKYSAADTKKLHIASVIFPVTDNTGTYIRQFYTTWKSTAEPMKTVPSRVRCALLSDNDIARKLEEWMKQYQNSGIAPFDSEGVTFIKSVLKSHQNKSVNWVTGWGDVTFESSGIEFEYSVEDITVPAIPEYGFGTTYFLNT